MMELNERGGGEGWTEGSTLDEEITKQRGNKEDEGGEQSEGQRKRNGGGLAGGMEGVMRGNRHTEKED